MKLITYCKACRNKISINQKASTRGDLQTKIGDEIKVNCNQCGKTEQKHLNDIKAETNNTHLLIAFIIGLIITIILWMFFGAIGGLGFAIPLIVWQLQTRSAKSFNSYRIKKA